MVTAVSPLVSIIITTYNHANYLSKAIQSALNQTYQSCEVIVIDDGSTDNTKEVIENFPDVVYFYQSNKGLAIARNTGLNLSKGKFILFLDADDWLYPRAIEINLKYLLKNDKLAFVSGNHFKVFINDNSILSYNVQVKEDHYLHFLKGNYVGMHATVMYNKKILKDFSFDQSLRTCEDYDMYLKIACIHPVLHHSELIAAYRLHSFNMSINYKQMLKDALTVLNRQLPAIKSYRELKYYKEGRRRWIDTYTKALYWRKLRKDKKADKEEILFLLKYNPNLFFRYIYNYVRNR